MNNYLKIIPEANTLYIKYRGTYVPIDTMDIPICVAINPDYSIVGFVETPFFSEAEECWLLYEDDRLNLGMLLGEVDPKEMIDYRNSLEEVNIFNFSELLKDIEYKWTL